MAPATPQQTYYVVLPAPGADALGLARPISRLVQKEEAEVRESLQCPTYQVFRRYAKRDNADGFRNQLKALGVESFIVSDTAVSGHLFLWGAKANRGAGGLAFQDFGGQPLYCPFDDVLAVCIGSVERDDGSATTLIDLHRRSTPITPRIDSSLFDFAATLGQPGVTPGKFAESIRTATKAEVDGGFEAARKHLAPVVERGLATFPGRFAPPADKHATLYDPKAIRLFDVYSFLAREHRVARSANATQG